MRSSERHALLLRTWLIAGLIAVGGVNVVYSLDEPNRDVPEVFAEKPDANAPDAEKIAVQDGAAPDAAVRRINAALNDALRDPAVRAAYARVGADPAEPNTPEQFAERARVDADRWVELSATLRASSAARSSFISTSRPSPVVPRCRQLSHSFRARKRRVPSRPRR